MCSQRIIEKNDSIRKRRIRFNHRIDARLLGFDLDSVFNKVEEAEKEEEFYDEEIKEIKLVKSNPGIIYDNAKITFNSNL